MNLPPQALEQGADILVVEDTPASLRLLTSLLAKAAPISMYDWRQLRRWDAGPARLPPDTLFVNRPPSVWEQHRELVLAGAAVIAILSLFSATLLAQRRQLRVAERRFRVLVERAPEAIVVYDARRAERLFGATGVQLLESGPERLYADIQPDGPPPPASIGLHAARGLAGEELVFERAVRAQDGRCFPCEVSVVALPASSGQPLRGGYVDIGGRKRAELDLQERGALLEQQVSERTAALTRALDDAESAPAAPRLALRSALRQLDMRQVDSLLAQYRYPALCDLLEETP